MPHTLIIREGTPADIPAWMALVRRVAWNFPGLENKSALQAHEATVANFIRKGNAVCGDRLIGVLLFSCQSSVREASAE